VLITNGLHSERHSLPMVWFILLMPLKGFGNSLQNTELSVTLVTESASHLHEINPSLTQAF